jgi:hypothetical protein
VIFLEIDNYFRKIDEGTEKWLPQPKGFYGKLFNRIVNTDGEAFEINFDKIKQGRPTTSIKSVISAFYSWKKKRFTKKLLDTRNLDIKIVKRGKKIGIIKIPKTGQEKCS